jgi:hypothetical protein
MFLDHKAGPNKNKGDDDIENFRKNERYRIARLMHLGVFDRLIHHDPKEHCCESNAHEFEQTLEPV